MAYPKPSTDTRAGPDKSNQANKSGMEKGSTPAATAQSAAPTAGPAASGAAVPFSGPSRTPYVPQFSAATQMILNRMRGETSGSGSATTSAAPKSNHPQGTYASIKEGFVFRSSKQAVPRAASTPSSTTPTTLRLPVSSASKISTGSLLGLANKKRKREDEDASDTSSLAEASDYGEGIKRKAPRPSASNTPTTTKSGRHILKPDTYDPAAEDNAKKRNQLGKRTAEQALCKKCTRMHSPMTNQMVFCDGCNDPWHQRCHEPWIKDEIIKDPTMKWYCVRCAPKREKLLPKKKIVEQQQPTLGPWPKASAQEKRAYFTSLSPAQLIEHLMHATELHPDLSIFPVGSTPRNAAGAALPRGAFAGASAGGLFSQSEANPTAQLNYIRKIPTNAKKSTIAKARAGPGSLQSKAAAQAQSSRTSGHQLLPEEEDASFTKLWPKPGMGMYSRLKPDDEDDSQLVDGNDYNAFSVIVFDERGKKIEENGVKV